MKLIREKKELKQYLNKMKIINLCFGISTKQIKNYLKVLPEIYKTCNIPILFINNNFLGYLIFIIYSFFYELPYRSYREFKKVDGTSYHIIHNNEPVFIYCTKIKSLTTNERFIYVLFHELRHWYQQKYLKEFHTKYSENYIDNVEIENYSKQVLEKDANAFSKKYCMKLGIRFNTIKGSCYPSYKRSKLKRI